MAGSFTFLPWVRQGMISSVQTVDTLDSTLNSHIEVNVHVHLNQSTAPNATKTIRLLGPGDVTGFDARQVIRTDPVNHTSDFEPNYFPVVEFDRPDFHWLFTPAAANTEEKLRPWICLIAVEKRAENLQMGPNRPLPVLTVIPNQELPDLSESWAWAHAQITGDELTIDKALAERPERTLSRLLCPRKLKSNTAYYACVVPTFEAGRKAGLGEAVKDGPGEADSKLLPAWDANSGTEISLPVYYHWEFNTGADGDFEALAWQLRPRSNLQGVGRSTVKVVNPDPSHWPEAGSLPLESALRPPEFPQPPVNTPSAFQEALRNLLNLTEDPTSPATLPPGVPIAPPLYGRWHAARRTIPAQSSSPTWLRDLNLNPTYRVAASIGTQIVQDQQEHLMASAWEQVGDILRANQALRQAQFSRAAGTTLFTQHIKALPAEVLFYMTGAVHTRVVVPDEQNPANTRTIYGRTSGSILPTAVTQGSFRRLTSSRSPLSRRLREFGGLQTGRIIQRLNDTSRNRLKVVPDHRPPDGMVTMEQVFQKDDRRKDDRFCAISVSFIKSLLSSLNPTQDRDKKAFGEVALAHQRFMVSCGPRRSPPERPLDLNTVRDILIGRPPDLVGRLDPDVSIAARFEKRIVGPPDWQPKDPLEPIMAAPEFPTPMYNALLALSQSYVLPGVENIPPNTITTLATNPRFIEAFMVGLNHEMGRELLWRGYPTDQRGTYFRQFWDQRGHVPAPTTPQEVEALKDIQSIPEWQSELGKNMGGGGGLKTVLLIRGDLLRRYPRAMIYAVEAEWVKDAVGNFVDPPRRNPIGLTGGTSPVSSPEEYPLFQGTLPPDITFLGFKFDPTAARGDEIPSAGGKAGYFFVLQQPPTEPRYGLDETAPETLTGTWRDLAWVHVKQRNGYIQLSGLQSPSGTGDPSSYATVGTDKDIKWGSNSAAMAYITLQGPFRVAIHATDLLPA